MGLIVPEEEMKSSINETLFEFNANGIKAQFVRVGSLSPDLELTEANYIKY